MENASVSENTTNPVFLEYKTNNFFHTMLFTSAFVFAIISFFGMPMNTSVFYITLKYRKAYRTLGCHTGTLLALNCLFEVMHQSGHFVYLAKVLFMGTGFVPLRIVFPMYSVTLFGFACTLCLLANLSADRLLAIAFPILYRHLKQSYYIPLHFLPISYFIFKHFYTMARAAAKYPDFMMTGGLGDIFTPPGVSDALFFQNVGIMLAAIFAYMLVGVLVKCKTEITNERLRHMYRSIFLIVFINIGGYFIINFFVVLVLLGVFELTPIQFWYLNNAIAIGLNIAAASNGPILFFNSKEYRSAYKREWDDWKKKISDKLSLSNTASSQGPIVVN